MQAGLGKKGSKGKREKENYDHTRREYQRKGRRSKVGTEPGKKEERESECM